MKCNLLISCSTLACSRDRMVRAASTRCSWALAGPMAPSWIWWVSTGTGWTRRAQVRRRINWKLGVVEECGEGDARVLSPRKFRTKTFNISLENSIYMLNRITPFVWVCVVQGLGDTTLYTILFHCYTYSTIFMCRVIIVMMMLMRGVWLNELNGACGGIGEETILYLVDDWLIAKLYNILGGALHCSSLYIHYLYKWYINIVLCLVFWTWKERMM